MNYNLIEENGYQYIEEGEGFPIIVLHGLMGNLSNFNEVTNFFMVTQAIAPRVKKTRRIEG